MGINKELQSLTEQSSSDVFRVGDLRLEVDRDEDGNPFGVFISKLSAPGGSSPIFVSKELLPKFINNLQMIAGEMGGRF